MERSRSMQTMQNRRQFIGTLSAGAVGLVGTTASFPQEAALEISSIRIAKNSTICIAPQYVADDLLRAEGFTDIQYVERAPAILSEALGRGEVDFSLHLSAPSIVAIDSGDRIALIAGVHVGCLELFAKEHIRSIRDLKGRKVGVQAWGGTPHIFLSSMAAYVGLDPARDIDWVLSPSVAPMELFVDGKIDAFLGTPPEPQQLRTQRIGHVIVNSNVDRPWSQYFCCMLTGNRDFVRRHPVATKRVLRAILRATDFCVSNPAAAARRMVDDGFTDRYDYALQTLKDVPFNRWRDYDPEDTIRFYALRLREAGMIKSTPNRILAEGTDWRFLDALKREMKG
jgi:NitT/TauT family transport system substrate-binding protein